MFVDDEDRILDGLRRSMHTMRAEWSMRFANSGPEALLQLAMEPADVVISDMRMPTMDGAQLLAEVKRLYPQAIRFILSGHSESESIIRATRSAHRYLSKPCDAQALKVAIARAANLRTLLNNDALAAMVGSVDTLPTPPTAYMQLRDLLRDPEAAIADVVDVLQRDIGLTAKVVKLANSGFFGSRQPVQSIERAVSIVGTDAISALVLGKELYDTHAPVNPGFSLERLGQHSFEVAAWARAVALHEGLPQGVAERAFLAGVLHDIGRLIFAMSTAGPQAMRSAERAGDGALQSVAHHAAAGAYLLGLWAFPESIVEAVLWHHSPSRSGESELGMAGLVHIGDLLAHERDPGSRGPRQAESGYLQALGLAERWPTWLALRAETASGASDE
jgi:HD-like signal output (HDOD) protein/CheY-like chemotaxis protein